MNSNSNAEDTIGRGSDQARLRFPNGMRERLKQRARASRRSMNAEIIALLEASMAGSPASHKEEPSPDVAPVADHTLAAETAYANGFHDARRQLLSTSVFVFPKPAFEIGARVEKFTGDYMAKGEVVGIFAMKSGAVRFVVEHQAEGGGSFCHIYSEKNLRRAEA